MNASSDDQDPTRNGPRVTVLAAAPTAATLLVFIPVLLGNPFATEAVQAVWLATLFLAPPLTAYLASRLLGVALNFSSSLLVGLPQLPLTLLLSIANTWLAVHRGHLLGGSGEDAMSYVIGGIVAFIVGTILLILVALAARIGARQAHRDPSLR
jgi:hypothetical protein